MTPLVWRKKRNFSTTSILCYKAQVNEGTLLRTHCCLWCFLGCANWETFVADTKCFWTKSNIFCVPGTKFVSATNVARAGKWGNICVSNNVSSFARAFRLRCVCSKYLCALVRCLNGSFPYPFLYFSSWSPCLFILITSALKLKRLSLWMEPSEQSTSLLAS